MAQGDKKGKKSNGGAKKAPERDDKAQEKGAPKKGADEKAKAEEKAAADKGAGAKAKAEEKAQEKAAPKKDAGDEAKAEEKAAPKKGSGSKAVAARDAHTDDDHDDGHKAAAHGGHGHHQPDIKQYFVIFAVLFVLTVLEVVVAQLPGLSKVSLGIALVGLALTKAACVALYYMHLKGETRILRMMVAMPLAFPMVYAFILIAEAAWRHTR